jgi:hypothetical protein
MLLESSQAEITAKKGFINSEGCNEKPTKLIHRLAPLMLELLIKVKITSNINIVSKIDENILICLCDKQEKNIIKIKDNDTLKA